MAYSVLDDIRNELKEITISTTSVVKEDAVTEFIVQADALIDNTIGDIYVTPIDETLSPSSFSVLKNISTAFVAYRVSKVLNIKKAIPIPENNLAADATESDAYKEATKLLLDIQKGLVVLQDAIMLTTHQGIFSYNTSPGIDNEPDFEKDVDQW